jgi:hypothetical protein
MQKSLFVSLVFICSFIKSNSQDLAFQQINIPSQYASSSTLNQTVYICTGDYAYAYHSRSNCPGLNNCKGEIRYADESTASSSYRRVPCCRCWSNVSDRCKDDNPTYGGGGGNGGGGDGVAIIAAVVIVGSAIILSNDIYAYPTYSIRNGQKGLNQKSSFGWSFGFRKTFSKSALEYGVSLIQDQNNNNYYYNSGSTQTGFHLNFVHELLKSKMPKNITVYAGPSLNYLDDFGYGGLIGGRYQLLKRLNFDLRYELTSQTNNIKLGLIFNYQRKYFWQK